MEQNSISSSLSENEEYLRNTFGNSFDIEYRHLIIPVFDNCDAFIIYVNNMADEKEIDRFVLTPLMECNKLPQLNLNAKKNNNMTLLMNSGIFVKQVEETSSWTKICDAVMHGDTVLFVNNYNTAIILSTSKLESRSISEPVTENEVRGPRDGFVENIETNCSLIRRRITDYGLRFENMKIGERTKTDIVLVYINSLVNDSILNELKTRLNRIKIDAILGSAYIEELIEDAPNSVFPQIDHTERPDKACNAILEGRIVIIVNNTPFLLIVPTIFWNFIHTSGDYYDRYYFATFLRCIRIFCLYLGLTLSSLYVLLSSFHQEMLPTVLALKIAQGRQGVPFPAVIEALMMEIIMDIMKEASLRMPKALGQTVSIVGALIIGQVAVIAGVVSPTLVIFIATAAICSYAVPSLNFGNAFRLIRYPLLIATSIFGLLGFFGGIIIISLHLLSLRSFGEPFMAPVIPFDKNGNKDIFVRSPWWKMTTRSKLGKPKDMNRQAPNQKPKPPESINTK